MKERPFFLLLLLLMLTSLPLSGCGSGMATGETEETTAKGIPVEVKWVERGSIQSYVELSGEIDSNTHINVIAGVNGKVASINVGVGDRVEQGQLLVVLENRDLAAQVQQAEASLELARANLIATREVSLPKRMEQLRSSLQQAEINLRSVKQNYERMEKLYQEGIISEAELDGARREFELVSSQYEAAREQWLLEKAGQEKEMAVVEAQVCQAEATVASARTALEKTRITAPASGTVTMVGTQVGEEVSPGSPLLVIVDFSKVYVEARVTEKVLETVQEKMPVTVSIPATGASYEGVIEEISLSPLPGTRSYPLKAYFEAGEDVRIGQHARLLVVAEEARDVLVIPRRAVLVEGDTYHAFVVEEGVARERILLPGIIAEDYLEVKEGLQEGEMVVIKGQHFLSDGAEVNIVGGVGN